MAVCPKCRGELIPGIYEYELLGAWCDDCGHELKVREFSTDNARGVWSYEVYVKWRQVLADMPPYPEEASGD